MAAQGGYSDTVSLLLANGADPNAADKVRIGMMVMKQLLAIGMGGWVVR